MANFRNESFISNGSQPHPSSFSLPVLSYFTENDFYVYDYDRNTTKRYNHWIQIKSLTILIYETVNKFQISVVATGKIGLLEIATT